MATVEQPSAATDSKDAVPAATETKEVAPTMPMKKRKKPDSPTDEGGADVKDDVIKTEETDAPQSTSDSVDKEGELEDVNPVKRAPMSRAREIRLEQNRKAARESRRRKKVMIEELQRSVIFFSRANSTLKQQNEDLSRMLMQAQAQVSAIENHQQPQLASSTQQAPVTAPAATPPSTDPNQQPGSFQQAQAQTVATQAMYESQGFPAAAARAVAHTMNPSSAPAIAPTSDTAAPSTNPGSKETLPTMEPGASMQQMASFQQAAAAAMKKAVQGLQGIPGVSMSALATPVIGTNPQQAYTDTMTALAMQQAAAAAAAGQQFLQGTPFIAHPMIWAAPQAAAPIGTPGAALQTHAQAEPEGVRQASA